jgi:hypothetical protein
MITLCIHTYMCVFLVFMYLKYIRTYARTYVRMCVQCMYVTYVLLSKVCYVCGFEGGKTPTAICAPLKFTIILTYLLHGAESFLSS